MNTKGDRLLELLILIGYSVEFPTTLAKRIGGHEEWNRHVMYRAVNEGYVELHRKEDKRLVIRSLRLTEKGLDYIAERDPESMATVYARTDSIPPAYSSQIEKLRRLHSIAVGLVMAKSAGALIRTSQKPYLTVPLGHPGELRPDSDTAYYYSPFELRPAMIEMYDKVTAKSPRLIGIIVRGQYCYCMYYTGGSRMFWMRLSEENYAARTKTLLNRRSFSANYVSQIMIGSNMGVAAKLCRSPKTFGDRFFVVSRFYSGCHFITNNSEGDELLSMIIFPEQTAAFNRRVLAPFQPPEYATREYDAVEVSSNRPVILNYTCDLCLLASANPKPKGLDGRPIMLCFDYQTQTVQDILGPSTEVRPIIRE